MLLTEQNNFTTLKKNIQGEFYDNETYRILYSTDASAYQEMPMAVCLPKNEKDIQTLIQFAKENKIGLIPRTAGTSLAGQVVGNGIVVDVSKYFNQILEINEKEKWVRVQMGVVRDELNRALKQHNLMFAPETSTANRAMIGGMIGNNSCGSNSIIYGSTREHILELKGFLSDGENIAFSKISKENFENKIKKDDLEGKIYKTIQNILTDKDNQTEIRKEFPKPNIPRRNTGYALDLLLETSPFTENKPDFDMCKLIAGSEGTLMFLTEAKLNLVEIPSPHRALICGHYHSIDESLRANLVGLKYAPTACELIDDYILDCTKDSIEQSKNRFFVQGNPKAILVVELIKNSEEKLNHAIENLINDLKTNQLGYHFPILKGEDMPKVWDLRKAGLGLLGNIISDDRPVPVIEDTAVDVQELPEYIREFNEILKKYKLSSVHYAHAGSGELHLRPILNLKTKEGNEMFRTIAQEIAVLVKKYKGSLSGEHGDGRLRGEFIPQMLGEKNYELLRKVKNIFDENNIFNPNKIIDTPPMNTSLRYMPEKKINNNIKTILDFSDKNGIITASELCNGSGDCRKSHLTGSTMCPSYMATRNEKDTTRARANILRDVLSNSTQENPFANESIKEVMDLCIGCKGCKAECPSNVDMTKMKAEFLHQYYKEKGVPFRTRLIANINKTNQLASILPSFYNFLVGNSFTGNIIKKITGFATQRSLPKLSAINLYQYYQKNKDILQKMNTKNIGKLYLFVDEFTNYNDTEVGIACLQLLFSLGYEVKIIKHSESGRTYLSKGLLDIAKKIATKNVTIFSDLIDENCVLIGLEPSAILSFRDEYPQLLRDEMQEKAKKLAKNTFTFEEFLAKELDKGNINSNQFTTEKKELKLHGHCHQKAISSLVPSKKILSLPQNYSVQIIPSGCCGMAGAFGYEKEHYEVSMQIGELVLFPAIRKTDEKITIAAAGTSCRHQIFDGTKRKALHPAQILWEALRK
ncbi:MAG: FAD-binding oxidoreductase [Bacteroidetes bacterium]|nr:MAG: FAD-binding oxidoreductase [Bacteroidota bacterium]TAG89941.1 MAG: FAD-binding oxidoreductase [Bacteroidota bacterium]